MLLREGASPALATLVRRARRAHVLVEPVIDPSHGFLGLDAPVDPRIVRYGSCEFRSMDNGHGLANPVGFPLEAVRVLQEEHGISAGWQNIFVIDFETLPADQVGVMEHYKLDAGPDVAIVAVGAVYGAVNALGDRQALINLRDQLSARAPVRVAEATYRAHRVVLPRIGRAARPYSGLAGLQAFVELLQCTWPDAVVMLELPLDALLEGSWRPEVIEQVRRDVAGLGEELGLEVVDHAERLGGELGLRCLNGYNLNAAGSRVVGRSWADRLARRWPS